MTRRHPLAASLVFCSFIFLAGCAGSLTTVAPLGAALSNCSAAAAAPQMVPGKLPSPVAAWSARIADLDVIGPNRHSIPPPILAASFRQALEQTLRQTGLLVQPDDKRHPDLILKVTILSQNREGSFKRTRLELIVAYTLLFRDKPEDTLNTYTARTQAEIDDWKIDACTRLRKLQERLSRENIEQAYRHLFLGLS